MAASKWVQISIICDKCYACTNVSEVDVNDTARKARKRAKLFGWTYKRTRLGMRDHCPACAVYPKSMAKEET